MNMATRLEAARIMRERREALAARTYAVYEDADAVDDDFDGPDGDDGAGDRYPGDDAVDEDALTERAIENRHDEWASRQTAIDAAHGA